MGGLLLGASKCDEDEGDHDATPSEGGGASGSGPAAGSNNPSGSGGSDTGSGSGTGEKCGARTCEPGLVCCNASCGRCVQPGMVCTQEACGDGGGGGASGGASGGTGGGDEEPPVSSAPACGGIAARECPGLGTCADDPSDSCDPRNGGADCGGKCQCEARPKCRAGQKFDASPGVCSCVGGDEAGSGGRGGGDPAGSGGATGGGKCGANTCAADETCCNPSCGICTKPGEGCTKQLCPPDDPGDPVKEPQRCGGFAGFPCPGLGDCVDDPSDDCDPENGGADCGGICKCTAGPTVLCEAGKPWNPDPKVCACAAPADSGGPSCGKVTCGKDQVCCNSSCGICTAKGGACIQIACP